MKCAALGLALLLAGCAGDPWMDPGEPIVKPGKYKRVMRFRFYAGPEQLQAARRADPRLTPAQQRIPVHGYAFPNTNEIHAVMPVAGDPYWICILGHEVLHELTHAPNGAWHIPVLGGTECAAYTEE